MTTEIPNDKNTDPIQEIVQRENNLTEAEISLRGQLVGGLIAAGRNPENRRKAAEWAKQMKKKLATDDAILS